MSSARMRRKRKEDAINDSQPPPLSEHGDEPDEKDLSLMNTEPLDASVFDTEPMEDEGTVFESESENEEEENSENEGMEEDMSSVEEINDVESNGALMLSPGSTSETDADDDCANDCARSPPPAIDISMSPSSEIKRIYSDLIDSCRGFTDNTLNDADRILKENINTGGDLSRQMEMTLSNCFEEQEPSSNSNYRDYTKGGNSASELHLACQHTKVCATMLKQAVKNVGASSCVFKLDEFLESLRDASVDQEGGYSVLLAVRKLAYTAASVSYAIPLFHTLFGSLDKDDGVRGTDPPPPTQKEAKVRQTRRKEEVKEEDATQMEVVNENPCGEDLKNDTPEWLARDIIKTLKNKHRDTQAPQNMLSIAYADNLPDVVSRLFGIAFVVRDGHVGISRGGNDTGSGADTNASLMLQPQAPPKKDGQDDKRRQQYIASFSSKYLKEFIKKGPPAEVGGVKKENP